MSRPGTAADPASDATDMDEPTPADGGRRSGRLSPGRMLVLLVVAGLVGMWGYIVYLAVFQGRQPHVDRLDDPAFAAGAEVRCAQALDELGELPPASASPSAEHRAGVLDQANTTLRDMLDDLGDLTVLVPEPEQRSRAEEWLQDWRIFLGDREDYAEGLRTNPETRLLVSEKPGKGRHVTGWIDEFAKANHMPSCADPDDA